MAEVVLREPAARRPWIPPPQAARLFERGFDELTPESRALLSRLPLRDQYPLVLVGVVGLTHSECAALVGRSQQGVTFTLARAAAKVLA